MSASVVEPVLDHAAAERARLVNDARARLLRSGKAVTIELIANATGRSTAAVRQWVTRQRAGGSLVTVIQDGVLLVPTFQLDDGFGLDHDVAEIVARLVNCLVGRCGTGSPPPTHGSTAPRPRTW